MRSVLVQADASPAGRVRIETALSLARMTGGHVTLLVDTPISRYVAIDAMGGGTVAAEAMKDAIAQDDTFAREIDAHVAREDVPCVVLRAEAEPVDAVAAAARLADVVIVARREALASDLPMAIRAPVLAVNDDVPLCFPLTNAAVAWDGSNQAAYALRCAVPLLATCAAVTVLTVEDSPEGFPAGIKRFLVAHEFRTLDMGTWRNAKRRSVPIQFGLAAGCAGISDFTRLSAIPAAFFWHLYTGRRTGLGGAKGLLDDLVLRPAVESLSTQWATPDTGFGYRWRVATAVLSLRRASSASIFFHLYFTGIATDRALSHPRKKREVAEALPVFVSGHHAAVGESTSWFYHRHRNFVCISLCRMGRPQKEPQSIIR